jgi:hypothetical protein
MTRDLVTTTLGSIKLSYEQPLSDEHLQGVEDMIRQAGLTIYDCRRYTAQPAERIDYVVEIIANYDDLPSDQWSELIDSITKTYCWPVDMGTRGCDMRLRISASEVSNPIDWTVSFRDQ